MEMQNMDRVLGVFINLSQLQWVVMLKGIFPPGLPAAYQTVERAEYPVGPI